MSRTLEAGADGSVIPRLVAADTVTEWMGLRRGRWHQVPPGACCRHPASPDVVEPPAGVPVVLPEPVRARVVALAADALGALGPDQLPAPLRRVAGFTPPRRVRLAGTRIALTLESDSQFRERVAVHVRTQQPDVAGPLLDGTVAPAADPVELAALAYLLRPDGWAGLVRAAADGVAAAQVAAATTAALAEGDRLRERLAVARDDGRRAHEQSREREAALRNENAALRQRLAETRRREREARAEADDAVRRAGETELSIREATAAGAADVRRLRSRLVELEAALASARRDSRDNRDAATTRTRLLVDTLAGAVHGLRRELALPTVEVLPADTVAAAVPTAVRDVDGAGRAMRAGDPALLEALLALPRVHLVVDGYNVTKTGYATLALDQQRQRLLRDLASVVARTGAEVTVVFDGADLPHPPPVAPPRGVRVLFSPHDVTADDLIRTLVAAEPAGRPLVVVSTDREVAGDAVANGARAAPSQTLLDLLARS